MTPAIGSDEAAERDLDAFDQIFEILNGTEWDSDTLQAIAEVILSTGRTIDPPEDEA